MDDDAPPEPPPIETMPTRRHQPMEVTYPVNYAPQMIKGGGDGYYGSTSTQNTVTKEAKKRQRRSLVEKISGSLNDSSKVLTPTVTGSQARFLKSASNHRTHHRFFRKHSMKDSNPEPKPNYTSPMFQLRYKSLTNLATVTGSSQHLGANEYDTLDSSNSGGAKNSGESSSSANRSSNLPEKRTKRGSGGFMNGLSRPKSLTNLVWGGFGGSTTSINMRSSSGGSRQNLLTMDPTGGGGGSFDVQKRLEPGVYGHYHPTSAHRRRLSRENLHLSSANVQIMHGKKLGGSKRIGTLYL